MGCYDINRDIPSLLNESGVHVVEDSRMYIPGPRILCYNYWGTAKSR